MVLTSLIKKEKALLEEFIFGVKASSNSCSGAKLNPNVVGKTCFMDWVEQAGFSVSQNEYSSSGMQRGWRKRTSNS